MTAQVTSGTAARVGPEYASLNGPKPRASVPVSMTTRLGRVGVWAGMASATFGCATGPGKVTIGSYQSDYAGLAVVGQGAPESAGLMPKGWKLDNFFGSPTPDAAKSTDAYMTTYRLDADGNGVYELSLKKFLYELRFVNLKDDGVIWLRVAPVSTDLAEMALPVLVEAYVDAMSGGSFDAAWVDRNRVEAKEKRYTAMLTSSQPCQLGGVECQIATIELADVDQVKLSPSKRYRKLQVLIARAPLELSVRRHAFPTYLIAGYSNQPARFDADLAEFQDFLGRIVLREHRGLTLSPQQPAGQPQQQPPSNGPGEADRAVATVPTAPVSSPSEPTAEPPPSK